MTAPTKPLAGLRVLDLTRLLPGPMCTLHLADMGADVIKIEDPATGDYARWYEPRRHTHSAIFLMLNRNKRSVALDLRKAEGREAFLRLAETADVIVESFRPGVMDRLGIGFEAVRARNPRIVFCALSGYGATGPYRDRAGHDINYCAYAGVAHENGPAGGPPVAGNFQIADLAGGALSAAMGILAAVVDQRTTGKGRFVDVAMADCTLAHAVIAFSTYAATGAPTERGRGRLSGGFPAYGFYEAKDGGYVSLGALEPKFWANFCRAVGREDWIDRHEAAGAEAEALRAELAALFKTRTRDEWARLLDDADCCLAPVLTIAEAAANEQFRARGMIFEVDNREDGTLAEFALPIRFSDFEFAVERPAPRHGEHTAELLAEVGLESDAIAALSTKT
ncbi:MAG TPA: CaiB/BaiF CoA-transferase family protein [Alphaproteobacteria bacterium]